VTIYLVRHAKAGSRRQWDGDDDQRPLSKAGSAQARAMAKQLSDEGITRVISSPFVRCVQTVQPLVERIGVELETSDALAEGATLADALQLLEKHTGETVALCTHGDVLGNLLMHYVYLGLDLPDDRIEKGSVWVLEVADDTGEVERARYLAPPD
jgi:8-oxo-dGTP diphosphatase